MRELNKAKRDAMRDPEDRTAQRRADLFETRSEITIRETNQWGACNVLGTMIRQTDKSFFLVVNGRTKRLAKLKKVKHAGCADLVRHIKPCNQCPGVRDPRACIHGTVGYCESCRSM